MRSLTQRLAGRLRRNQAGFTLVELLVVVGIIVALGAVIVPNVIQFASSGEEGAQAAEGDSVQTAIDTYMADQDPPLSTLPAGDFPVVGTDSSTRDFTALTGTLDLETGTYLRTPTTQFFYCWNASGLITRSDTAATVC